jgi:dTDP-4-dehydrorhamnose reductase
MNEKVLIFGSKGQIGTALERSAPAQHELYLIGREAVDFGDERELRRCINELRPTIIINAAAYTAVDKAETDDRLAFLINAEAPKIIGQAAALIGARVVHYSTDYVFDGQTSIPYLPSDSKNPLSIYGASKSLGEDHLQDTLPPDRLLILRTAWVYACGGKNFVNTIFKLMESHSTLRIVADQFGTPTSASSIAEATWIALGKSISGINHYTDAGVASWYDFACQIERLARSQGRLTKSMDIVPITSQEYPQPATRPKFSVLNKSGFWQSTQITPRHWIDRLAEEYSRF